MKLIKFNINNHIKVRLFDEGYQILANNHNNFIGTIPNWEKRDMFYYKYKADKDGYTKFQMHFFIDEFKNSFDLGSMCPFNCNILIEVED